MALKAVLSKADYDALPEAVKSHYAEKNGNYQLDAPGLVPDTDLKAANTKLAEFRDNNIVVMKERDELKTKLAGFDGVDAAEYKRLKEKATTDPNELTKMIETQTKPLKDSINALMEDKAKLERELQTKTVDDHIRAAAVKAGVRETAVDDVLWRGRQVFKFKDGKVVALDGDKPLFSAEKPSEGLAVEEWLTSLSKNAEHLFKSSSGGGSGGSDKTTGVTGNTLRNPDARTFGKHAKDIAEGKIQVVYDD